MARRGQALREHIVDQAKLAFLESGFERTSMDAIAARAETSKRSLYAHFATKEVLFRAVADRVEELFLGRLQAPGEHAEDLVEAVTLYLARYLQLLSWESAVQTCRLGVAAAAQYPEAAARLHSALFDQPGRRLADFLTSRTSLSNDLAYDSAAELTAVAVLRHVPALLLGTRAATAGDPDPSRLAEDVDLGAMRRVVSAVAEARGWL